jgi:hypothetical protein
MDKMGKAMEQAREEAKEAAEEMKTMLLRLLGNNNTITPSPVQTNIMNNNTAHGQLQIYGGGSATQAIVTINK